MSYTIPYANISDDERNALQSAMRELVPSYVIYDERIALEALVRDARRVMNDKDSHEIVVLRNLLRADRCREIPHVPEPYFWILFTRLLWNFHYQPDPWFEIKWWIWCDQRGQRAAINMAGCQNSLKSFWMRIFAITQLVVWDKDCKGYLSGPYKTHTEDKLWSELKDEITILERHIDVAGAFGITWNAKASEVIAGSEKGHGFLRFIASQDAASVVGSKTKDHTDTEGRIGIQLFMVDEYVENVNTDIERGFGNFRSNYNSCLILACNPNPSTALHPNVIAFIDPIDRKRSEMRKHRDFRWRTRKGIVVRFDWNNCPNRIVGRNEWPYMMNELRKASQEHESEANRAGQLDAWPFGAEGAASLTDTSRQEAAGVFHQYYFAEPIIERYLALDPAFGGRDPAVYTICDVGYVDSGGDDVRKRFVGIEQAQIEGIDADFIATDSFVRDCIRIAEYREARGESPKETEWLRHITTGSAVGAMAQGAVIAAALCIDKDVPFSNFTFDASQRADCADWIFTVFGRSNIVWYYEGSRRLISEETENGDWYRWPYRTRQERGKEIRYERWSDWCGRVITMIWGFSCELINNGYLIGGKSVQRSLDELGAREIAPTPSGKVDVWSKQDIKRGTFQGKKIPKMSSPAWGETLAMLMYFAVRYRNAINLGERPELQSTVGEDSANATKEWLELMADY